MSVPPDLAIICPVLVGRAPVVTALERLMEQACAGQGATVLLAGEAGIGKSRLVSEISRRFTSRPPFLDTAAGLIVQGHCFEPDRGLPYAPFLDLLRSWLCRCTPAERDVYLGADAVTLAALLPELTAAVPTLASVAASDPEQEKRRLFQALLGLFSRLAGSAPLLVVLEDLHWSDDTSLEFLLHLLRRVPELPVLLLLTYRSDEVTPALRHTLALLDRERLASEITLGRLAIDELQTMLQAIFVQTQPIRADFLHAIHALTEGNPFFVEEVIRSLIAVGDIFRQNGRWERKGLAELQIPRSVHDAVLRRSARLTARARSVLRLAAVAGRLFDFDVLQALTHHDEGELLDLIRELIDAQLVVEESADRFAFRHALTRQAIYSDLLARERRALHLAIAGAMERLHAAMPDPYLADLSYHFAEGEAWAKAEDYATRAATRALSLHAPRAAVDYFTRALDAAAHLRRGAPDGDGSAVGSEDTEGRTPGIAQGESGRADPSPPASRLPLSLMGRGRALAMLGEVERALTDHEAVLALARTDSDHHAEWQALLDLGNLWAGRDYARAGDYFAQASRLAAMIDAPLARAQSLTQLGGWYLNTERTDEAAQCLQTALEIFEQAGDRRGIAGAVDLLGTVYDIAGDVLEMRRHYERAAVLFRELDDRQVLSSTLATMALHAGCAVFETVVTPLGIPPAEALRETEQALELARGSGVRSAEAYALLSQAICLLAHGEYGRALAPIDAGLAIADEIQHGEWMTLGYIARGLVYLDLLALPCARKPLERACMLARAHGSLHFVSCTAAFLAEAEVAEGHMTEAAEILATFAADLPMRTLGQRRVWTARAKLALAQGAPASALEIVDRLLASAVNLTGEHDIPLLALLRGESLAALGRHDEAGAALHAALGGAAARGFRPICWRSHLALGRLHAACRRHAEAERQFHAAGTIATDLAATLPADQARAFLAQVEALLAYPAVGRPIHGRSPAPRVAPADQPAPATRDGGAPPARVHGTPRHWSVLTAREREVAALVARGLANRAIAETLVVGERTVETHVGNILGKLGFSSRAQIAAWAIECGLARTSQ